MKTPIFVLSILVCLAAPCAYAQGQMIIQNPSAPTRLWTLDGPIAGPGIWGQMFAGLTPDSLAPVGVPVEHNVSGRILGGVLEVPTVPCFSLGYTQMVAWDGRLWGTELEGVPANQFGKTDVVSLYMNCDPLPIAFPHFNQPAIVPIPEPSILALAGLGLGLLILSARKRSLNDSEGGHRRLQVSS